MPRINPAGIPPLAATLPRTSTFPSQSTEHNSCNCVMVSETHAAGPVTGMATSNGLLYTVSQANASLESWAELGLAPPPLPPISAGPPTSAVAAAGSTWVATAHRDLKIRLYRPPAAGGQLEQVASLPSLRQFFHNWTLQRRYVQTRRHGKKRAWMQHSDTISALAFSADCSLLYSASWDRTVKVWSLQKTHGYMRCEESFTAHVDSINVILVGASDGLLYTGSADKSIKVWSRRPCKGRRSVKCKHSMVMEPLDQGAAVNALVMSHDGTLLYSGGSDGQVLVWRRNTPAWPKKAATAAQMLRLEENLQGHSRAVLCLDLLQSNDGMPSLLVSGSADQTIRLWRQQQDIIPSGGHPNHECLAVVKGHSAPVRSLQVGMVEELRGVCTGVAFSGGLDGSIKMWMLVPTTTSNSSAAQNGDRKRNCIARLHSY